MPTVTLDSYNSTTGCLYFTIYGTPIPSAVTVLKSTNNGLTWTESTGSIVSPRCGFMAPTVTLFRLRLEASGVYSNILSSDGQIPRTQIVNSNQITFCNSPIHLYIQNSALTNTIQSTTVELWIWSGAQNKVLGNASVTFKKSKVSAEDDYINIQIEEHIKAFLEKPTSTTLSNQPGFGYNVNDLPAVSGQGVFWQIRSKTVSSDGTEIKDYPTNFATLGYTWNYEQNGQTNNPLIRYGSLGFAQTVKKWYNPNVPKYFNQDFVYNQSIDVATSSNMISMVVEAKTRTRCTRDSALIVYIDKRGLWDVFTPHGKIIVNDKVESTTSKRIFRKPTKVNNTIVHSSSRDSLNIGQSYTINTGSIDESDVQRVEEIIYSPKVYLIRFLGDVVYEIISGTTIDSTFITIDNTIITIDNTPIVPDQVPYFNTFQQIPVVVSDSDFQRKTLTNDRNQIDYTIKFDETTNKIN